MNIYIYIYIFFFYVCPYIEELTTINHWFIEADYKMS